jgi:hypothetical protein
VLVGRFEPTLPSLSERRGEYDRRRSVAYLDLLGFSNAVCLAESSNDELDRVSRTVEYLRQTQQQFCDTRGYGAPCFTVLSDSVVISIDAADDLLKLTNAVGGLAQDMLHFGFIVRGGITSGALVHDDRVCYGPAFIRAYELESKTAIWPRIVVDGNMLNHLVPSAIPESLFHVDQDGMHKLDYLRKGFPCASNLFLSYCHLLQCAYDLPLRHLRNKLSPDVRAEKIYQKLEWFLTYAQGCAKDAKIQLSEPVK